jgi:hypothetical protein
MSDITSSIVGLQSSAAKAAGVALAALLAEPHPQAAVLRVDGFDCHTKRRTDPGEGIDHQPDQRVIAQASVRRHIDAVEQRARFGRITYPRFPAVTTCRGPLTEPAGLTGTT